MNDKKLPINVLLIALAIVALLPGLVVAGPPQLAPVSAGVWDALRAGGQAEILVVLPGQPPLQAGTLPTKEAKGRHVYQALQAAATTAQGDLLAFLQARGAEYRPFYIVNAVWVRADEALVRALAARPDVARIAANPRVRGLDAADEEVPAAEPAGIEQNLIRIHADAVWALGYTGQGVVVAGQDTGYNWQHPALKDQYRGWDGVSANHDYNWHDAIHSGGGICGADSPEPCDDHSASHGTHTMGIMVGDDGANVHIGVAPGAQWIGCRNMDQGVGTPASYMECFEFFLAPYPVGGTPLQGNPDLAPDVVNNSWGCPLSEGCDATATALMEQSVQALRQAGIVVVASAGNAGSACSTVSNPPALYEGSFSVANFDHRTDLIVGSSSRGPVTFDGKTYIKPNIAAPGYSILSSVGSSSYARLTGTSMAAPHVAGAVALLLSAGPGYVGDVEGIEQLLTASAEPKLSSQCGDAGPPNSVWGWGILDTLAGVNQIPTGSLQGTVADRDNGEPLPGAEVAAVPLLLPGSRRQTITDPSGVYTFTLAVGDYQLVADAPHYTPQILDGVTITAGETTTQDATLAPFRQLYLPLVVRDS